MGGGVVFLLQVRKEKLGILVANGSLCFCGVFDLTLADFFLAAHCFSLCPGQSNKVLKKTAKQLFLSFLPPDFYFRRQ